MRASSWCISPFHCSSKGGGIPKSEHKKTPLNPNSRTRAFRLRGTTLLRPALAGKTLCWRKNQPGALTDATPSRAHCSPVQAPRPCSAPRGLPASILRAFCQAQTMRTLLFSANAIIMFIIRKKSGFVNKNMKKEPSQSKPDGFASSPEEGAFGLCRNPISLQKSSPEGGAGERMRA